MSSRLNTSNCQLQISPPSSTDILYRGLRRKISQNEYTKIYPKLKISNNQYIKNLAHSKNEISEQALCFQANTIKIDKKNLVDENNELKSRIKKMSKLNEIYQKKLKTPLRDMSLDKLVELKLMIKIEDLQQILAKKEQVYNYLNKQYRKKREKMDAFSIQPNIQLHQILIEDQRYIDQRAAFAVKMIDKKEKVIQNLKKKLHRLQNVVKVKSEQLKDIDEHLHSEQYGKKWKQGQSLVTENNDSGIYNTKNKLTIENLQKELQQIKSRNVQLHLQIQKRIDEQVTAKIILYKNIDQFKDKLVICKN